MAFLLHYHQLVVRGDSLSAMKQLLLHYFIKSINELIKLTAHFSTLTSCISLLVQEIIILNLVEIPDYSMVQIFMGQTFT